MITYSTHVSGNLIKKNIRNVIFVKPETFDKMKTLEMLKEIDTLNTKLVDQKEEYILIGFGRWGTSDRFLGIPAKWNNISGAKTIIEAGLEDFQIDFSQGSHFFHNIVSSNIGYIHVRYNSEEDFVDWDWLKKQKTIDDLKFVKHIRTNKPVTIRIDAQKGEGLIIKPE